MIVIVRLLHAPELHIDSLIAVLHKAQAAEIYLNGLNISAQHFAWYSQVHAPDLAQVLSCATLNP